MQYKSVLWKERIYHSLGDERLDGLTASEGKDLLPCAKKIHFET